MASKDHRKKINNLLNEFEITEEKFLLGPDNEGRTVDRDRVLGLIIKKLKVPKFRKGLIAKHNKIDENKLDAIVKALEDFQKINENLFRGLSSNSNNSLEQKLQILTEAIMDEKLIPHFICFREVVEILPDFTIICGDIAAGIDEEKLNDRDCYSLVSTAFQRGGRYKMLVSEVVKEIAQGKLKLGNDQNALLNIALLNQYYITEAMKLVNQSSPVPDLEDQLEGFLEKISEIDHNKLSQVGKRISVKYTPPVGEQLSPSHEEFLQEIETFAKMVIRNPSAQPEPPHKTSFLSWRGFSASVKPIFSQQAMVERSIERYSKMWITMDNANKFTETRINCSRLIKGYTDSISAKLGQLGGKKHVKEMKELSRQINGAKDITQIHEFLEQTRQSLVTKKADENGSAMRRVDFMLNQVKPLIQKTSYTP